MPEPEPMFLLTKKEWEAIIAALPEGDTCGQCREAIARDALRKVAAYVKRHSTPSERPSGWWCTIWGREEWDALMREAGLDKKEVPDA